MLKVLDSPVLMSWINMFSKLGVLLFLTPIALSNFTPPDSALWLVYLTLFSFILLFDMGFSPTFVRIFGYTLSGRKIIDLRQESPPIAENECQNWIEIRGIYHFMTRVYLVLAGITILISASIGSYLVANTINSSLESELAWQAWTFTVLFGAAALYVTCYSAFLQGMNQVALVQRTQLLINIVQIATTAIIMLKTYSIVYSALNYQFWMIISGLLVRRQAHKLYKAHIFSLKDKAIEGTLRTLIIKCAWRSGIGIMLSTGVIQFIALTVASLSSAIQTTQYLLVLQIVRSVGAFSAVPFYSKLPLFSKLYAENNNKILFKNVSNGMRQVMLMYFIGNLILWTMGPWLFNVIGSQVEFPSRDLLLLLILGFAIERFSAMHMQFYSLTNHIIWHKINFITGLFILFSTFFLFNVGLSNTYFAWAIFLGNVFVFLPLAFSTSYKKFKLII